MSRSNIKGAFERALERWHFGAMHTCGSMGRGAFGSLRTVGVLFHKANRERFYKEGNLVAFPGLDLMALLSGMNEKTLRRHLHRLEKAGVVRIQQRYNQSNLYFLTIPPDAETQLYERDQAIIKRRKHKRRGSQVSTSTGQMGTKPLPSAHLHSDLTSDLHSFTKWCDEGSHRADKKEREVAEEERGVKARGKTSPSDSPSFTSLGSAFPGVPPSNSTRSDAYRRARHTFGDRASPIIAMAEHRGASEDEICSVIDEVISEDGDVNTLAHRLLHGGEDWNG